MKRALKPRQSLPVLDDTDNGAWWRGWWQGAPLWFVLGACIAVVLLKK